MRAGVPLQLQVHTDLFSPLYAAASLGNALRAVFSRFLLRRASCVRAVSPFVRQELEKLHTATELSTLSVYIDEQAIHDATPIDLRSNHPQFETILIVVARLEKEKRIQSILRAMKTIAKEIPRAGLFIAGDGRERASLERYAKELGIQKSVVFLGYRSDAFGLYKTADLMLAATAPYEGYGAATVEALSAGCPVVSLDVGVAQEAGAVIASPQNLAQTVIDTLRSGERGVLRLRLPSSKEWSDSWGEGLRQCAQKL